MSTYESAPSNTDTFEVSSAFETDFSEYTTGNLPSDWTKRWVDGTWTVAEDAGAEGGKWLDHAGTVTGTKAVSWNDVDNTLNGEITAKGQVTETYSHLGVLFRGSGAAGSETGYVIRYRNDTDQFSILNYDAGVFQYHFGDMSFSAFAGDWLHIKVQFDGTSLKGKIWKDGDSEPASWMIDTTDGTHTTAGWVGFFVGTDRQTIFDTISVTPL